MNNKSFDVQNQIRQNADKIKETYVSLKGWEDSMKINENKKLEQAQREQQQQEKQEQAPSPPVRSNVEEFQKYHKVSAQKMKAMSINDDNKESEQLSSAFADKKKKEANEFKEKGNTNVKNKEYETAIKMYNRAIELCNSDPVFYSNRSQCYLKLEKYQECIDDATKAIELDPSSSKSFYRRMTAYEHLGEDFKAMQNCRKMLELTPDDNVMKQSYDRILNRIMEAEKKKDREKVRWSRLGSKAQDTDFVERAPHLSSKKPLKQIPVRLRKAPSPIPEAIIDKIFNNNTGETVAEPETDSKLFKSNFLIAPKPIKVVPIIEDKKKVNESNEILKANENKKDQIPSLDELEGLKCSLIKTPFAGPQFYSAWKELNEQSRFLYLKNIADHNAPIGRLLGAMLDSDILCEIIFIIHKYFLHFKIPYIRLLKDLSCNKEISLLAMFWSDTDKKYLNEMLAIPSCGDNATNDEMQELKQKFQI